MKVFRYGLALALVTTLVAPALAKADDKNGQKNKTFDICVDPATDFRLDNADGSVDGSGNPTLTAGDVVTAVGIIVPGGTIPTGGVACSSISGLRLGTFFVKGNIVAGLPQAAADDLAFIDWDFRIDGKGEFTTSGIVKNLPVLGTYPHLITGATGGVAPAKGKITVTVLAPGGFEIRVSLPKGDD